MRFLVFGALLIGSFWGCKQSLQKSESQADWSRKACILETTQQELWSNKDHRKISYECKVPKSLSIEESLCREASFRGEWKPCPSKGEYSFDSLRSGSYFFEIKARVSDGSWIESPLFFWKVDTIAPTLLDFEYSFLDSSEIFNYSTKAIDSGSSGIRSWECRYWPVTEWKTCQGEGQGDFSQYIGVEKWEIRVSDRAGNYSPSTFIEAPKTLRNIASQETYCQWDRLGRYWVSKNSLTLSFTCLSGNSSFEGVEYEEDEKPWAKTPSARHLRFEKLEEGSHKLKLRVRYSRDHFSPSFPFQFGIDSVAPKVFVSDFFASENYFVARIESSDDGSGVQTQECKIEHESGRLIQDWTACNGNFIFATSGMRWSGNYKLSLRAKDYANNYSENYTRTFQLASSKAETCFGYENFEEDQKYMRVNFYCDIKTAPLKYECRTNSAMEWQPCQSEDHHLIPKTARLPASFEVRAQSENGQWTDVLFRYLLK